MAVDKKISELPDATLPISSGVKFEAIQGGVNVKVDADDMPGSGGGTWGSITGTLSAQTDLYNYLRAARVVTGADAIVQADDNALIIFNSASPFNFTLDQITASSKASFINIGAGAVTFVAGAGVTITGSTVLSGATGTNYPTAFVFYHTATTPRTIISGVSELSQVEVDTTAAPIVLNFNSLKEIMFEGSDAITGAKSIEFDNDENALVFLAEFNITNVAGVLDFPDSCFGPSTDSRFNNTNHTFTVPTGATGHYKITGARNIAGTVWRLEATNQFPS